MLYNDVNLCNVWKCMYVNDLPDVMYVLGECSEPQSRFLA